MLRSKRSVYLFATQTRPYPINAKNPKNQRRGIKLWRKGNLLTKNIKTAK
ncbi:MAG: hypothetical protein GXN97_01095 [Aquificae bacterium]|nr:hypothetical protein [Aquificota bacterium]